jgi:hypothetical protein
MTGFYAVTTKIKDTLALDAFVNTITIGDIFDVDLNKQTIFPLSHLIVNTATKEDKVMRFSFTLLSMDLVNISKVQTSDQWLGNDNTQDVLNTQLAVQSRLTELLKRSSIVTDHFILDGNPTFEPFTERFENSLAGWACTFDVLVPNDMTIC